MKTENAKIDLLRSVPGLAHLAPRDLVRLASLFDDVRVKAGTVVAREGQLSQELVLIIDGRAALSRRGNHAGALGPGEFVGEAALFDRAAHTMTATAETPMRVLLAGRESLGTLRTHPDVLRHIAANLTERLRYMEDRSVDATPGSTTLAGV